jgi:hypothetical protein
MIRVASTTVNEAFQNLYSLPFIQRYQKLDRMRSVRIRVRAAATAPRQLGQSR